LGKKGEEFDGYENGFRIIFKWQPLSALDRVRILPSFLHQALRDVPTETVHVVHRDAAESWRAD